MAKKIPLVFIFADGSWIEKFIPRENYQPCCIYRRVLSGIVIMCNMAPSWNQLQIILASILEVPISSRNKHYLLMAQDYYASHSLIKSKSQTSSSYCYPDLAYQRFYTLNKDVFLNAIFWLKLWMRGIYLCALWESLLHCIIKLCTNFNRAKLKLPCEMPW